MEIETKKTILSLSPDLLTEILPKLPVKSLFRFKCVSKSWLSLISQLIISHPKISRLHFELTASYSHRLVLFKSDASQIQSIDFNKPLHDASASSIIDLNFSFLPLQPHDHLKIVGSCHGFILLHSYPNLYLCNPTTGFHKQLPSPPDPDSQDEPFLFGFGYEHEPFLFGFGYDLATDDYLVTLAFYNPLELENTRMELFSLKANVWKVWEGHPLPYMISDDDYTIGLFFNGALHWIAYHRYQRVRLIVVFDLMKRSFSEIALPPCIDSDIDNSELRAFGGFLSLCVMGYALFAGDIWVMEEYKVESSWNKLRTAVYPFLTPMCRTESGDIVGVDAGSRGTKTLVKVNVNGEVIEERPIPAGYISVMYTESLLSLPQ